MNRNIRSFCEPSVYRAETEGPIGADRSLRARGCFTTDKAAFNYEMPEHLMAESYSWFPVYVATIEFSNSGIPVL